MTEPQQTVSPAAILEHLRSGDPVRISAAMTQALGCPFVLVVCHDQQNKLCASQEFAEAPPTLFSFLLMLCQHIGAQLGLSLQWVGQPKKGPQILVPRPGQGFS
jgi:hypothetical protein